MTILSFHPVKHVATGEGGMVLTNSKECYELLLLFRTHGITRDPDHLADQNQGPWYYEMQDLGYNYRLTDIQSALGLSQLKKLDASIAERSRIAEIYRNDFCGLEWLKTPPALEATQGRHSYHLYPVLVGKDVNRRDFFEYMRKNNIGVQVHYVPVHLHPYYQNHFGFKPGDFIQAEAFYDSEVSLPMYYGITEGELETVISLVKKYR